MHHITKIEKVENYKVYCLFDNKEVRSVDFTTMIMNTKSDYILKLKDINIFNQVKLDLTSKTLYWENLAQMKDYDGQIIPCELDFDPTVLYNISEKITTT